MSFLELQAQSQLEDATQPLNEMIESLERDKKLMTTKLEAANAEAAEVRLRVGVEMSTTLTGGHPKAPYRAASAIGMGRDLGVARATLPLV